MGEAGLWREHVLGVGGHVGAPQTTVVLRREQADALLQGLEHVGLLQWCQKAARAAEGIRLANPSHHTLQYGNIYILGGFTIKA